MQRAGTKIVISLAMVGALAGCDTSQGIGRFIAGEQSKKSGPDEFAIVPTKPLELPEDLAALPAPAPGTRNLTDPLPAHDAVAALGGQPARLDSTNIGAGEGALLAVAERNGTSSNIREVLAEEDEAFREKNGPKLLERWFKVNTYLKSYKDQTLKSREANEILRRKGIKTPTVSPEDEDE